MGLEQVNSQYLGVWAFIGKEKTRIIEKEGFWWWCLLQMITI